MNTKQVIVIRKDLNMRKGKMCSMAAHASLKVILDMMTDYDPWDDMDNFPTFDKGKPPRYTEKTLTVIHKSPLDNWINGLFTKITCGCDSLEELEDLYLKAKSLKLPCSKITDMGLTEFGGVPTITAIAIGPAESDQIDKITSDLKLL